LLFELKPSHFSRCENITNPHGHLEVRAIIGGNNPGRVFVDDEENPASGLVWLGNHDGFFFIGDEENYEFNRKVSGFIDRVIAPQAQELGLEWFECFGNHHGWEDQIEKIFSGREMQTWNQKVLTFPKGNSFSPGPAAPAEGFSIIRLGPENFTPEISNYPFWLKRICEFWGELDRFFALGFGYGILRNKEMVGICFSGFARGDMHGIDIETLPSFQGRKFAQIMARSFVGECGERGLMPYWDCMEGNKASEVIARKIGLVESFSYRGFEFAL